MLGVGEGEGGNEPGGEAGKGTTAAAARRSASEISMVEVDICMF